ncbi:MAG: anti sigma factor C-terminal domain-containing protein [Mobilitalea sp.]
MTYRELLDLYKRNELELDKKHQVEADIEKHEAISDYLYEKDDIPALSGIHDEQGRVADESLESSEQARRFMKMVNQSIRRAFVKMGFITSVVALVILLLIQFVLPQVISIFYYDPGKEVAGNTNQMSLDIAIYTELLVPQYIRFNAIVEDLGYGNYDFCITQNSTYNGVFTNVSGRIERGRMIKYDANALTRPTPNAFAYSLAYENPSRSLSELEAASQVSMSAAGFSTENLSSLNALSDDTKYVAYVTLEKPMGYLPFIHFLKNNSINNAWCAVSTNWNPTTSTMLSTENIGFQYGLSSYNIKWDKERYPDLILDDYDILSADPELYLKQMLENLNSEDFMQKHFISMLRYMSEQKNFLQMMDTDPNMFTDAADYVEENGLLIYGFSITTDKEQLLKLAEQEDVFIIYTQPLR